MTRKIFLSYSREDTRILSAIVAFLQVHFALWYDQQLSLHAGQSWWDIILDEIAKADVFVFLLSKDWLDSRYCRAELKEALRLNKPILPVKVHGRNVFPPSPIDHIQFLDVSQGITPEKQEQLLASIQNAKPLTLNIPRNNDRTPLPVPNAKMSINVFWSLIPVIILAIVLGVWFRFGDSDDPESRHSTVPVASPSVTSTLNQASLTPSPTSDIPPSLDYPCDAKIVFTDGSLLSQIRVLPRRNAPFGSTIAQGAEIIILSEQFNDSIEWYQIRYDNPSVVGWIPIEYVEPSSQCPQE